VSAPKERVLVVDDDAAVGKVLVAQLAQSGFAAVHVPSAEAALAAIEAGPFDAVLSDVRMPGKSGIDLTGEIARRWSDLPVILLTAFGTIPLAVEAMKRGASDFMLKPFDRDEVLFALRKAILKSRRAPAEPMRAPAGPAPEPASQSPAMRDAERVLLRAATATTTVLLRGETGTGKGLAARRLHEASARRAGPFVTVQCGALPDDLIESELFGYEKGAFTGAACRKPGRVELARGGTLFLDEIGDVPLAMQAKLLRLVQERTFERLGGTESLSADVRIVAATHQPLEAMVAQRTFREDLFYRLNVVPIVLPPLRERPEDIVSLAVRFAASFGAANGRHGVAFTEPALARLRESRWPGNVRQLENLVERLVVLADGTAIDADDVDRALGGEPSALASPPDAPLALDSSRREAEVAALTRALAKAGGNRTLAARLLGVSRRTLYNKLAEHGLG
jgi:DNA-binding NtrC family response regulator